MVEMSTRERVQRMFDHKEADRIPVTDIAWQGAIARWQNEGMPKNIDYVDYFGLDKMMLLFTDNSPRFESKVLEETDRYKIYTTAWGTTQKEFKELDSTPQFLDFKISDPDSWRKAKTRITPTSDRVNWRYLEQHYRKFRDNGAWMSADLYFGFDWMHSWVVGTETILIALLEEPEWCVEMFNHFLDTHLALFDMMWKKGYVFDAIRWPDDLGYKGTTFFSTDMYKELLKPVHKKAIDWAHNKGIKACLHSCGQVTDLIPEFIDIGLDCLNPLEVKAGVNPCDVKKKYGDKLVLHGGANAANFHNKELFIRQMKEVIPIMKESGGYIFSSDHSVPPEVSLKDYQEIIDLAKKLGSY